MRGRTVKVGTLAFVTGGEGAGVAVPPEVAAVASASNPGRTPVFVAIDGTVAGVLEMEDEVRADAASAVARLQRRGLRTVLLSGDLGVPRAVTGSHASRCISHQHGDGFQRTFPAEHPTS